MTAWSSLARTLPTIGVVLSVPSAVPAAHAVSFSGNAILTSDNAWRGTSQSQGDAQAQTGFRATAGDRDRPAQLGAMWAFKAPVEPRLTYHATNHAVRTLFPGLAGSRVEAALQATF